MMFRKKKTPESRDHNHGPRGRDSGKGASALAHRFLDDEEPDTIDLAAAPGFPSADPDPVEEPDTQVTLATEPAPARAGRAALIRYDSENEKFYLDPEAVGQTVCLSGEVVTTTTELRKGDCIRVGDVEFTFSAAKNTS